MDVVAFTLVTLVEVHSESMGFDGKFWQQRRYEISLSWRNRLQGGNHAIWPGSMIKLDLSEEEELDILLLRTERKGMRRESIHWHGGRKHNTDWIGRWHRTMVETLTLRISVRCSFSIHVGIEKDAQRTTENASILMVSRVDEE